MEPGIHTYGLLAVLGLAAPHLHLRELLAHPYVAATRELSQPSNAVIASVIPITASPPLGEAVAEFLARRDLDDDTRRSYGQTMTRLRHEVDALLSRRDVPLREKTLWRLLYESAARADSVLSLDIEDLDKFLSIGADRVGVGRPRPGDSQARRFEDSGPGRPSTSFASRSGSSAGPSSPQATAAWARAVATTV